MLQAIFEDMLREGEPDPFPMDCDQILHHTPHPNLNDTLSLRFPQVVAVVPQETPAPVIRWTPKLPPWIRVPSGLL